MRQTAVNVDTTIDFMLCGFGKRAYAALGCRKPKSQHDSITLGAMPMKFTDCQRFLTGLLLLFVTGCQTVTSEPVVVDKPIVETPQDSALSKLVRDRLHAEKKVDLTNVKVESSSGAVYLSGSVPSLDAREHAIKSAWEVRGVQSVVNRLTVKN
jgi:osmotically-inducible protein OsmY